MRHLKTRARLDTKAHLHRLIPREYIERFNLFKIYFHDFLSVPPILMYQMGKVGSQTVRMSLIRSGLLSAAIYSPHFLSKEGIESALRYHLDLQTPYVPFHLRRSMLLRRKITRYKDRTTWKVISLVRDPISRELSDFFTNVREFHPELIAPTGEPNLDTSVSFLLSSLRAFEESSDYVCNWFDKEMKIVFDIDVYNYPFITQKAIRSLTTEIYPFSC